LYGGVGYFLVPGTQITSTPIEEGKITVARHPIEAFVGHRYRNGRFSAYGEMVGIFDLLTVSASDNFALKDPEAKSNINSNRDRLVFGLAGRGTIEYTFIGDVAGFVGFSIEDYLGNFEYVYQTDSAAPVSDTALLSPIPIRANLQVGLSFSL
jgi:hypothetical protein